MNTLAPTSTPSAAASEDSRFEWVACASGWLLMIAAISQLVLRSGLWIYHGHLVPATVLTLISVAFIFLLRPRLGSYHELPAVISAFVIFITALIGLTHVLANEGDWPLARLYQTAQAQVIALLGQTTGEGVATFAASPMYLLCAFVLLLSFAYRSHAGFILFISIPLLHGLYPWNAGIITAYLLWFAGFLLLNRDTLYLPRAVEDRLRPRPAMRELLLEARDRPLTDREVLFYLGGGSGDSIHDEQVQREIATLADAGLLEYSRDTGKVYPTALLERSYLPAAISGFVELASNIAGGLVLLLAGGYMLIPIDLIPEALVGPLGYADDLILLALGALPLGSNLLERIRALIGAPRRPRG